jgi:hypothetical protein
MSREIPIKFPDVSADMWNMTDRRSEGRMMCADMVEVSWSERSGKHRSAIALLEDISASGACIQLEMPVPKGVEIRWDAQRQEFRGTVRYCVYREIGYFVGVEFEPSSRWSRKTFAPQHLLDPQTLAGK